jgi:hypothetical protein
MTDPPADITLSADNTHPQASTTFMPSKTGWYQLSMPGIPSGQYYGGQVDWIQIERGSVFTSYHGAEGYLQRTGVDIVNGLIVLNAETVKITNNGTTAALFTDGKIKGEYLHVGGFTIDGTQIKSDDDKIILNKAGTATIGKMTVAANGNISATDVDLTGKITATSGKIGNFFIVNGVIKSSESNPNILLNPAGQSKIGNMTIDNNGDITVSNMTANDGTFKGVLKAEKGITYKVTKFDFTNSSLTKTMSNTDVIASCYTNAISQAATLFLPQSPLDGQMVYINNIIAGNEWVVIKSGVSGRGIYPSSFLTDGSIKLNRNASVSLVYDNQRNQWWVFSANNT